MQDPAERCIRREQIGSLLDLSTGIYPAAVPWIAGSSASKPRLELV